MDFEFDGATEMEAVRKAKDELKRDFEYEIVSETKKGLFKKPTVRIRVLLEDEADRDEMAEQGGNARYADEGYSENAKSRFSEDDDDGELTLSETGEPENDMERDVISFISGLSAKMQVPFTPRIISRSDSGKINVNLDTDEGSFVIGYKGERLDAIQIITSSYVLKKYSESNPRIVLDVDGYRQSRIQKIVNDSVAQAKRVKNTGRTVFLEPLNSYERREVHKAVDSLGGLATESYGNGLLKRIKICKI